LDDSDIERTATGEASSYRRILWATSLVGGATLTALVIGLARNKAVALVGGPSAVGLLGLFTALVSMVASISTVGLDTSGVRQLSQQHSRPVHAARTKRAIWTMAWPLAILGGSATWFLRKPLASFSAADSGYAAAVGVLGIGVAASVIGAVQVAVLQGSERVADVARVKIWGSLAATTIGVLAVYFLGVAGIVIAVIATPLATCLFSFAFGRGLPGSDWSRLFEAKLGDQWRTLALIGAVVTVTNVVASLGLLSTRALITHRLGLASAGLYHASWSIASVNLSLVLNAMAADYFPRLSKVADEPGSMSAILNQQIHVALLLAGPVLTLVSLLAPVVLTILYSSAFSGSALLLRLLLAAGVLRLPIWALGYILLARRAPAFYFLGEVAAASIVPLTWLLLPAYGLTGAAIAAVLSALFSLFFYLVPVHRSHGVRLSAENGKTIALLVCVLLATAVLFEVSTMAGLVTGLGAALALSWRCYRQLRLALAA